MNIFRIDTIKFYRIDFHYDSKLFTKQKQITANYVIILFSFFFSIFLNLTKFFLINELLETILEWKNTENIKQNKTKQPQQQQQIVMPDRERVCDEENQTKIIHC